MTWFVVGVAAMLLGLGMWVLRRVIRSNGPETFVSPIKPHCTSCGIPLAPMSRWRALSLMPVFVLLDLTLLPALAFRWLNYKALDLMAWFDVPTSPDEYRCGVCAQWHEDDDGDWEPPTGEQLGFVRTTNDLPFMCNEAQYRCYVPLIVTAWEEKQFGLTGWWDE